MIDDPSENRRRDAHIYVEDPAVKDRNVALATVLASLAAAAGLHAVQDSHSPDPYTPPPSPRPSVGQPNADYTAQREKFVMPPSRPVETPVTPLASVPDRVEAFVEEDLPAEDEEVKIPFDDEVQGRANAVYLPSLVKAEEAGVMESGQMADVDGAEDEIQSSEVLPGTHTPQTTATPRYVDYADSVSPEATDDVKTTEMLLLELNDATGVTLVLAMDHFPKADIEGYMATEKSVADENLQRLVAEAILGLPDKVRNSLAASAGRIVIVRNILDEFASFSDGQVITMLRTVDDESGEYKMLDAFDGSTFDAQVTEAPLPSKLQPATEATFAVYENLIHDYFLSDAGQQELQKYVQENLSETEIDNVKYLEMLRVLGYPDDLGFATLEELAARINAFKMIGRDDIVEKVRALGVLKMGHMPWL